MNTKIIILKILFCSLCFGVGVNVFAIGMVTDPIIINDFLRGGEIIETITILNSGKNEAMYDLGATEDINGWVEFFEVGELDKEVTQITILPKTYYDVIAKIKVPADAPNGEYVGEIIVKDAPKKEGDQEENTVSILKMVSRDVKLEVSDNEIIKIGISLIPEKYDLEQGEPLKVRIIYENLGNIILKPSMQVKIANIADEKTIFNAIFPYAEEEVPVIPGERKEISVFEWQTDGQIKGRYQADIKVLVNGEVIQEENFRFNLGLVKREAKEDTEEEVSGRVAGLATVAKLGGGNLVVGWFVIGIVLLIIAGILFFINKRRNR